MSLSQHLTEVNSIQPHSTPPWQRLALSHPVVSPELLVPRQVLDGCRVALQRIGGAESGSVGVTSTLRGEGRSIVALGLAVLHHVDRDRRTILLDLDLEEPAATLADHLQVRDRPGIAEIATGEAAVEDCMQSLAEGLWLIPAGTVAGRESRILSMLTSGEMINGLLLRADVVVVDLPPLLGSTLGLGAAKLCSQLIFVARAGVTPMAKIKDAVGLLPSSPPVILNGTHTVVPRRLRKAIGDWS